MGTELCSAQRLIERGMILNPLENPAVVVGSEDIAWFSQVGGWGSFGSYGLYGDKNHAWYQHLGAYMEIYRKGNESSLAVTGQIEFIADTIMTSILVRGPFSGKKGCFIHAESGGRLSSLATTTGASTISITSGLARSVRWYLAVQWPGWCCHLTYL